MLSATNATEREVLDHFNLTGSTPREAQDIAQRHTKQFYATLFNHPNFLTYSSILPPPSPDIPLVSASFDHTRNPIRTASSCYSDSLKHRPHFPQQPPALPNFTSLCDQDDASAHGFPFLQTASSSSLKFGGEEEKYLEMRRESAPELLPPVSHCYNTVSPKCRNLHHSSSAPGAITRGITPSAPQKPQQLQTRGITSSAPQKPPQQQQQQQHQQQQRVPKPQKQRRHKSQRSTSIRPDTSFKNLVIKTLRLTMPPPKDQHFDDDLLKKAHAACSFLSHISNAQPHQISANEWKRVSDSELHNDLTKWLRNIKQSHMSLDELLTCAAWMEAVDGVRKSNFRNCFLGGEQHARPVYIDSKMAQFANLLWLQTDETYFIIWRRFARRVIVKKGTSILHATGELYLVPEKDVSRAESLSHIWSVGLDEHLAPTGEQYVCEYFDRMLKMKNSLLQRGLGSGSIDHVQVSRTSHFINEMYNRLRRTNHSRESHKIVEQEKKNRSYRLRIEEEKRLIIDRDRSLYVVEVDLVALKIGHNETQLGVGTLKETYHVKLDITSGLGSGTSENHPQISICKQRSCPYSFDQDVVSLFSVKLREHHGFLNIKEVLDTFQMDVKRFARTHVLSALAYDHSLHPAHERLSHSGLCINNHAVFLGGPSLELLCASGWEVQDDTSYVRGWHGNHVHINRNGVARTNNEDPYDGIDTERPIIRCQSCFERRSNQCELLALLAP